jgi:lipoprotein-releasing system ATP-binding protein
MLNFELKDVLLGYEEGKVVLNIPDLSIHKGQLTFVTGPSGAGKSTLLEALGLMKNTILGGRSFMFNNMGTQGMSFLDIWNGSEADTDLIRRKHFSFIFQSTNLMPNFTLGENICFGGMLSGKSLEQVKPVALEFMEKLNLEAQLFDNPSTVASGGQRQRAAFIRALCKDFSVLFGDEPTGNLDRENAVLLFELLKETVKTQNRSAIIVSHDLDLAKQFADEILEISISTVDGSSVGELKN